MWQPGPSDVGQQIGARRSATSALSEDRRLAETDSTLGDELIEMTPNCGRGDTQLRSEISCGERSVGEQQVNDGRTGTTLTALSSGAFQAIRGTGARGPGNGPQLAIGDGRCFHNTSVTFFRAEIKDRLSGAVWPQTRR